MHDAVTLPALWTEKDAAEYLGVSEATVARQRRAGRIRCIRIGKQIRFRADHVEAYRRGGAQPIPAIQWPVIPTLPLSDLRALPDPLVADSADATESGVYFLWRAAMLAHKPAEGAEALRKRKSSVNRVITVLLAAFERAADEFERDGLPVPGRPWRVGLKKFTGVTGRRMAWLDLEAQRRLLQHCDVELRDVVHLMLITGLRPSEAIALDVKDYEPGVGALYIRRTKVGRADWLPVNAEGRALCARLTAGRDEAEPLCTTDKSRDGGRWHIKHVQRRYKDAVQAAGLPPEVTPYATRHSFASQLAADGVHSVVLANTLGHSTTRMVEAHYAHFRDTAAAQAIEALPRLLAEPKGKRRKADVVPIGRARKSAR